MMCETEIRVRYADTDQLGIVYHANYFPWFEEGRTDFMQKLGYSYAGLESEGLYLPLLECSCRFLSGARYDDRLVIRTWVERIRGVRVTLAYEAVRKKDGMLLARGSTTHAFVDRDFRPVNIMRLKPVLWESMAAQVRNRK